MGENLARGREGERGVMDTQYQRYQVGWSRADRLNAYRAIAQAIGDVLFGWMLPPCACPYCGKPVEHELLAALYECQCGRMSRIRRGLYLEAM